MTTTAEEIFVGLGDADQRLPARWTDAASRAGDAALTVVIVGVQLAWLGGFAYAAYRFVAG
jgi:hypothetical protein